MEGSLLKSESTSFDVSCVSSCPSDCGKHLPVAEKSGCDDEVQVGSLGFASTA